MSSLAKCVPESTIDQPTSHARYADNLKNFERFRRLRLVVRVTDARSFGDLPLGN